MELTLLYQSFIEMLCFGLFYSKVKKKVFLISISSFIYDKMLQDSNFYYHELPPRYYYLSRNVQTFHLSLFI